MKNTKVRSLIKLLDDEDSRIAHSAMSELLSMGRVIERIVSRIHESSSGNLRRRAHQMEAILKLRRKRRILAKELKSGGPGLMHGLISLHLQWFDEDDEQEVYEIWESLLANASEWKPNTLARLRKFMKDFGFTVSFPEECYPENYCIGTVIEDCIGADFILCSIAKELAAAFLLECDIVNTPLGFALTDKYNQVLLPSKGWIICSSKALRRSSPWEDSMLLRLAAAHVFLCSVTLESYRYVHTIGSCLSGDETGSSMHEILPYPLGHK